MAPSEPGSIATPRALRISPVVATSASSGRLPSRHSSPANTLAARPGGAAFLEPPIRTAPLRRSPPCTWRARVNSCLAGSTRSGGYRPFSFGSTPPAQLSHLDACSGSLQQCRRLSHVHRRQSLRQEVLGSSASLLRARLVDIVRPLATVSEDGDNGLVIRVAADIDESAAHEQQLLI